MRPPATSAKRDGAGPGPRMECGVCWQVYDPALGDPVWRVPPGTAFRDLPVHWTCPNCAALREQFLALDGHGGGE